MKIQELAIIFVIIILPISLLLTEYTQFQIQTLKTQTEYDSKLTAATYDAIKAFQLNSTNSTESGLANSEMRDLTASVNSFRNSLMSTFKLNGYTEDELNSYIPALVYTLYDGFYLYSPYQNENHRYKIATVDGEEQIDHITGEVLEYETDAAGNKIEIDGNGEQLYGIKPYISYSCRYRRPERSIDVVITYSLDNHITVQGMVGGKYVNKGGYLIEIDRTGAEDYGIYYKKEEDGTEIVRYNGEEIETEQLKEYLPLKNADPSDDEECIYSYAKINGIKYYLIPRYYKDQTTGEYKNCIVYIFNGTPIIQAKEGEDRFEAYRKWIENNSSARKYYIDAYNFTKWFQDTDLMYLQYKDAYDEVINTNPEDLITDGEIMLDYLWPENETYIFAISDGGPTSTGKSIETEFSNFNQHRLAVIRKKIETNLAIAIANYNDYSKVGNVFQIPQLKETEWDSITHNIGLISFMQGIPIGGKLYNGYSIVTNSESDKVVFEENIYILSENVSGDPNQKVYRRVGDMELETTSTFPTAGIYTNSDPSISYISAGRLNLDFERAKVITDSEMKYYYPLKEYNASYNSVVMQNGVTTYDDIYEYIENQDPKLAQAFYTALARERGGMYITLEDISSSSSDDEDFDGGDEEEGSGETPPVLPYVPLQFTLTYYFRDDANKVVSVSVTEDELVSLINPEELIPPIKKDGFVFSGWAESASATEPYYKVGEWTWGTYSARWHDHLYAIWEAAAYTVTYDANEGIGAPGPQQKAHNVPLQLDPTTIPTKEGYEFMGWDNPLTATSPDWDKESIESGNAYYTNNADVTLKAIWSPKTYTLTYYPNANEYEVTNLPDKQYWSHGDNVTISTSKPKRDGYIFMGWDIYSDSEWENSNYAPGKVLESPDENINLYAVWKESCMLYLDANGGKIHKNGGTYDRLHLSTGYIGSGAAIPYLNVEKTGYSFEGWADSPSAETAQYKYGDVYKFEKTGENVLYAVWAEEIKTYTITYNANGGSVTPSPITRELGSVITLPTIDRVGYKFLGWSTNAYAETEDKGCGPGKSYTVKGNATLYAVWIKTYTVKFILEDDETLTTEYENPLVLPAGTEITFPGAKKDGFKFLGWSTSATSKTVKYTEGLTWVARSKLELYPVWEEEKIKYTVTYIANGGDVTPSPEEVEAGKMATLPVLTREGYEFLGWSTDATSPTGEYNSENPYQVVNDVTLYAIWKHDVYIIHLVATNSNTTYSREVEKGSSYKIGISFSKTGHEFLGWSLVEGAMDVDYADMATIPATDIANNVDDDGNMYLYTVWEANTYTITYNANGGYFDYGDLTMEEEISYGTKLSSTKPQQANHKFIGWAKSSTATEAETISVFKETTNTTLYAVWEDAETYTITFDSDGGIWRTIKQKPLAPRIIIKGNSLGIKPLEPFKIVGFNGVSAVAEYADAWIDKETGEPFDSSLIPTKDMEFIAVWYD